MSGFRAVQLFNLAVPCDGEPIPALIDIGYPCTFRITMAAIDPVAESESKGTANGAPKFIGSTLRMIRVPEDSDDEDDEEDDSMDMAELLDGASESESDEEDGDPGPSDPAKSPKAKRAAALKDLLVNGDKEEEMELDEPLTAKAKGKGKVAATDLDIEDMDDSDEELDSEDLENMAGAEEFVLCTLDPTKSYQQTLDFTVSHDEMVYFSAMGTHDIYLTGNILVPDDEDMYEDDDEDEDEFDLEPDMDELDYDEEDESDELDDVRITEVDSEDEDVAAPALVKAEPTVVKAAVAKGKNKRAREDSELETPEKPNTDSILDKSLKPSNAGAPEAEVKLSKKERKALAKKLKDNAGNAVAPASKKEEDLGIKQETTPAKGDKKVQFAKTLVQGPTGGAVTNGDAAKAKAEAKSAVNGASKGERVVKGVTIDDRKLGTGPAAKKGDKVSMRYIGKLEKDKKVFDANKKGPPFTFKLGAGDVIKGWDIGVMGLTVGGERRITVPADLAYGSKGLPGIPANSTLVFDVKCLEIK